MKSKVVIAATDRKELAEISQILQQSYDVFCFCDISSLTEFIKDNRNAIIPLIASAAFLKKNGKPLSQALRQCRREADFSVIAAGKVKELETVSSTVKIANCVLLPISEMSLLCNVQTALELARAKKRAKQLAEKNKKYDAIRIREVQNCIIGFMASIVEMRNPKCGEHTRFVSLFTQIIASDISKHCPQYALTKKKIRQITSASMIHDIGKLVMPDAILFKPSKLFDEEYACMKTHTIVGEKMFEHTRKIWGDEYADLCKNVILYHHERYDGKGYPYGLVGEQIPIEAQIVSLADVYDALVKKRVYKEGILPKEAFDMIMRGECGAFSQIMLESLKRVKGRLEDLIK